LTSCLLPYTPLFRSERLRRPRTRAPPVNACAVRERVRRLLNAAATVRLGSTAGPRQRRLLASRCAAPASPHAWPTAPSRPACARSEEHTSELQSRET